MTSASGDDTQTEPTDSPAGVSEGNHSGSTRRYWIGVVSRPHVVAGVKGGFVQLSPGWETPLREMGRGDWLIYYSPRTGMEGDSVIQGFTAIGQITDDEVYAYKMSESYIPFRRNVAYAISTEAPIQPLIGRLSFTSGRKNWAYAFRLGYFPISEGDFKIIAAAMSAEV